MSINMLYGLVSWLSWPSAPQNQPGIALSDLKPVTSTLEKFEVVEEYDPAVLVVHRILNRLIPLIEKSLNTEGLYRISGEANSVNTLFNTLRADPEAQVPAEEDVHILTGVLKKSLRSLEPKLFPIGTLSKEKAQCVKILFAHLHKVSKNSAKNSMTAKNLSIVFTPTLAEIDLANLERFTTLFTRMIEHPA